MTGSNNAFFFLGGGGGFFLGVCCSCVLMVNLKAATTLFWRFCSKFNK